MKILLLGDSNTAGVYSALKGVYPPGAMAPADWELTRDLAMGSPMEYMLTRTGDRIGAGERYDVVVLSGHIGNAIGQWTGATWQGQPILKENAIPMGQEIAHAWEATGAMVIITGGHGVSPLQGPDGGLFDELQAFYLSYWQALKDTNHQPILSYRLPRKAELWPAAPDMLHASPTGYRAMASRLVRAIQLYF